MEIELRQDTYKAVKEACKWMIDMRNSAPLEGFGPWSDGFTNYKQGIMNTCEGLSAMFVIDEYNMNENLSIPILDRNILISDLNWLISQIEKEGYRGTPYLDYDLVENFTDAVSYGLTSFIGARSLVKGSAKENIEKHILNATNWLLSNKIEIEQTYGWSWMGSEEMRQKDVEYPPQTYFTYSALTPLCDLLEEASDLIADIEEDIIKTIQRGKDFLMKYNRENQGWIAFKPTGNLIPHRYDEIDPKPDLLATSYAILTLSYIRNNVQSIRFDKEDEKDISNAVNWMKERIKAKTDVIFKYNTYYILNSQDTIYNEGCAPYIFLNSLIEYYNTDFDDKTEEDEKLIYNIVQEIVTKCWGKEGVGFKHFVDNNPDSKRNIVVMYATSVAIESLLRFGVERPLVVSIADIINEEIMNAQTRIFKRLNESGIELEIAMHEETDEIVSQELKDKLSIRFDDMFMKIKGELTQKDTTAWADHGPTANVTAFIELFEKINNESDVDAFKINVKRFDEGNSELLFKPQANALSLLNKFTNKEIENEKERRNQLKSILEKLDKDIEEA